METKINIHEEFSAVKGICAWPNLQLLNNGELLATVFNQPSHGLLEGELECYCSRDYGRSWQLRSVPCLHDSKTIRMNCAVGIKGEVIIVCCGGWTLKQKRGQRLSPWICSSSDNGQTWEVMKHPRGLSDKPFTPFGNIINDSDGNFCMSVYLSQNEKNFSSYFVRSENGGLSWSSPVVINPKGDETCLLQIKGEEWMAASRESNRLVQYRSNDNGKTWHAEFDLTLPGQVTGHLTRLKDGKILLSYGNRNTNNCGVDIRISEDDGKNWGAPCRLANLPLPDCGYPSTVQLTDESLVTVYYAKTYKAHKYDMYSLKWKISYL